MKLVIEPTDSMVNTMIPIKSLTSQLNIYPNPVNEYANLSFKDNYTGIVDISIFNASGQLKSKIKLVKA